MLNKNILLVVLAVLLLSYVTEARAVHFEDAPAPAADAPKAEEKPAEAPKAEDKPAETPKAEEKPAEGTQISSVQFCGCEGAIPVTGEQLTANTSSFTKSAELKSIGLNWTNFKPMIVKCKDGHILKEGSSACEAVDVLLNQDLDAINLISSEKISELKKKQKNFFRENPKFKPIFCEEKTPYLSKSLECQACTEPKLYWDLDKLECVGCEEGQIYSAEERKCVAKPIEKVPVTNFDAEWFLLGAGEDLSKYKTAQEEFKKKNPGAYVCDVNVPYVVNNQCATCPKDNPLFYLPENKCVKCKAGSYYDKATLSCVAADPRMSIPVSTNNLLVDPLALSEEQSKFYLSHPDFRPVVCETVSPYYTGAEAGCIPCA